MYRISKAHRLDQKYEQASEQLKQILDLTPNDNEVIWELADLKKEWKESVDKERKMYANMFKD